MDMRVKTPKEIACKQIEALAAKILKEAEDERSKQESCAQGGEHPEALILTLRRLSAAITTATKEQKDSAFVRAMQMARKKREKLQQERFEARNRPWQPRGPKNREPNATEWGARAAQGSNINAAARTND